MNTKNKQPSEGLLQTMKSSQNNHAHAKDKIAEISYHNQISSSTSFDEGNEHNE